MLGQVELIIRCSVVSMPPQNQPVVNAFGLMKFQRRQIVERWRFRFVQDGLRHRFKRTPARSVEVRRVRNLPQQAAPFDDDAVNVARAD